MPHRPPGQLRLLRAHVRLFLIRYRLAYWALAAVCALFLGWSVHRQNQRVDDARAAWTHRAPVLVLAKDIDAGQPIGRDDVTRAEAPTHVVPEGRLVTVPTAAVARVGLGRGTILAQELIIEPGVGLDADHRGVALPVEETTPPLRPGQRVDLVSTGVVASREASVLRVDDEQTVVAVPLSDVAAVTAAAREGDLTIVLAS